MWSTCLRCPVGKIVVGSDRSEQQVRGKERQQEGLASREPVRIHRIVPRPTLTRRLCYRRLVEVECDGGQRDSNGQDRKPGGENVARATDALAAQQ